MRAAVEQVHELGGLESGDEFDVVEGESAAPVETFSSSSWRSPVAEACEERVAGLLEVLAGPVLRPRA
ncbi:hypothetical protein DEJ06_12210 [Curtobacterium sp. MCLR17_051]|nr:hypothetical protein DEJ07_11895 [Curtobacterium sp. MCLR17_053]PZF48814.1 hypothetical protein DEJ06_12210 [Curtobacterium sp. MCLR17_051]